MKRTPWYFVVTRKDGTAERCIFYARTKAEAMRDAEVWARRLGVAIEEAEREAVA